YGLCHTFNSGQDGHQVVKSITSGKDMGLALLVDIDTEEYYGNVNAWYNGIIMAIHNQHEQPMIEDNGMEIKPGFITNIRLKRHQSRVTTTTTITKKAKKVKEPNCHLRTLRSDLLLLYVYYQDLDTDVIIEVPSYNGTLFIPDVGGYLGLFMGCSVLTVCEFIDSLIIFCIRKYKARKSSHSDALQLPSDSPKTPSESLLKPPDFLENKDDDDTEAFDESKI
ncbi:hypothetical protein QZH41_014684, partial [Actinostola sp. cb2023]